MSGHPLNSLKNYDVVDESECKVDISTFKSIEERSIAAKEPPPNVAAAADDENNSKPAKRKRKKRLLVTKKEFKRSEGQKKRRQARQVVTEACSCYLSCPRKITPEQRQDLNNRYWELEHVEQKKFIKRYSVQGKVKRRRVPVDPLGGVDVKKAYTYSFYLPDDKGELQTVCCTFFLNTLGYRKGCGNHIYRAHMKDSLSDKRGKYERDRSLRDAIWDDILSYSPRTYHKGLKYSATALYLPIQLNAKMMHADFKARREPFGEKPGSASFYCAILREMDVHFVEMDDFVIPERKPIVVPPPPAPETFLPPEPIAAAVPVSEEVYTTFTDLQPSESSTGQSYIHPPPVQHLAPIQTLTVGEPATMIYTHTVEPKPVESYYSMVPQDSSSPFVENVKQEPYYGLPIEPETVVESHYIKDNDDFSDSYSNMASEPSYTEPSYHAASCEIVKCEDNKNDLVREMYPPVQGEMTALKFENPAPNPSLEEFADEAKFVAKPRKRRAVKSNINPPIPVLPEGYPPVKRTKKYIAKVSNLVRRKMSHPVLHLECNCHLNCREKISSEQQERINDQYWSMRFADQRMFMLEHTERHAIKRRRTKIPSDGPVRKSCTYSYRLTDESGNYQAVCCQFYLNTIGFGAGSGNVIYRAHQVELSEAICDKRGKFARDTTLRDAMDDDILSYFSPEQQESGAILDLSATSWSPKKMYTQYVQRQAANDIDKPGSFGFYWRRVKELNVQFAPRPEPKTNGKKKPRSSSVTQKRAEAVVNVPSTCSFGFTTLQ
ncbi:uncharacterized protein LOC131682640 [Topomyia yanbarensis]|uniref:uncharacterized protein LOC131682640 n=1 Tax=Topomyia yanbarensis TaxID=2498891 RepID=UPI00273AB64A|nr:uncharacterized protein LOC131682640 [Topomyia yanbarensis]